MKKVSKVFTIYSLAKIAEGILALPALLFTAFLMLVMTVYGIAIVKTDGGYTLTSGLISFVVILYCIIAIAITYFLGIAACVAMLILNKKAKTRTPLFIVAGISLFFQVNILGALFAFCIGKDEFPEIPVEESIVKEEPVLEQVEAE